MSNQTEEKLTISDILNRIRDNAATARRAMEEMDKYAVVLHNEVASKAKDIETLKTAYSNLEAKLNPTTEE